MMQDIGEKFYMRASEINNSSDMFLYKAKIDFNSAKYLLEAFNNNKLDIDIEKIYFELQQSSEKLLKSKLSKCQILFPKTHDIEQLIELCNSNNIQLTDNVEILIELSEYAVMGRYSVIHDDLNEADRYILIIERLL